jgi:hypothetical protein
VATPVRVPAIPFPIVYMEPVTATLAAGTAKVAVSGLEKIVVVVFNYVGSHFTVSGCVEYCRREVSRSEALISLHAGTGHLDKKALQDYNRLHKQ